MGSVWLTYDWDDDSAGEVGQLAIALGRHGVTVHRDKRRLKAGLPLWPQIRRYISDPNLTDAWAIYATENSAGSEACQREFGYAVERALAERGEDFPVIAIFPGAVDLDLLPTNLKGRLAVSVEDTDWPERVRAATERVDPVIPERRLPQNAVQVHVVRHGTGKRFAIEVRPTAGRWSPFLAAIPASENARLRPSIRFGPKDQVPMASMLRAVMDGVSDDGEWYWISAADEATPTQSYYIVCEDLPSKLRFGADGNGPQFLVLGADLRRSVERE